MLSRTGRATTSDWIRYIRRRQKSFWTASLITVALNGLAAVILAATTILAARMLGPRETGFLVWFVTGTTTIAIFGDFLGILYSNAYLLARDAGEYPLAAVRGTVLAYGLVSGIVAGLAFGYLAPLRRVAFTGFDGTSWGILIALNVAALVVLAQVRGLFWGKSEFIWMGLVNVVRSLLYGAGVLVCLYFLQWRLGSQMAVAQVVSSCLCAVLFIVYMATQGISTPRLQYLKACMRVGWRAAGVNWLSFLHLRVDQYMVNLLVGPTALGLYSVAVSLGEVFNYVPMMLGMVLFPIVAAGGDMRAAARKTLRRAAAVMCVVSFAMIPLVFAAGPVVRLLYGDSFGTAVEPLLHFIPAVIFLSGLPLLNNHISGLGYPVFQLCAMAVALAVNILCNLFLLPRMSATGAAISSSISYGLWFVLAGAYLWMQAASRQGKARSSVCAE